MGGRSSDSDTERSRKSKKISRSKRSRSRSSSGSVSSNSSDKRRQLGGSKYDSRNRLTTKSKSSPDANRRAARRNRSRSRDRKDFSRSSYSRQDRRYHKRSRSKSKERCKSKDSDSTKKLTNTPAFSLSSKPSTSLKSTEEQLKMKMQLALKAAADADALLRQQGLLTAKAKEWGRNAEQDDNKAPKSENKWPREPPLNLNVKEQIDRAKAMEEINAPGFQPQVFTSGIPLTVQAKETERVIDTHDSAIFGGVTDPNLISVPKMVATTISKNTCVAHENLFSNIEAKEEKWIRKLILMRQRKLNGEAMC